MRLFEASSSRRRGGKAGTLLELQEAGFRVPEFVCSPEDVGAALNHLGSPVVVRSSASAEDGQSHSFAGQFQSFLGLRTVPEVTSAIRECHNSLKSPAVLAYCSRKGIEPESLRMAVIVQRMIRPELAGVAFTVNPATGAEEVVIEACEGLADDLLLGRKPPLSPNHHLVRRYAPEITAVAKQIHRYFGAPQDIEFAVQDGLVYVLQARPITRIDFSPTLGVWTNADFRDGGVSSTVCTPLMWSLYDYIWQNALTGFLREIKLLRGDFEAGRVFFGRPYWNLGAVKECLTKLPGFNERQFDEDLSVRVEYEGDGVCTPVTVRGILSALPTILAIPGIWKKQALFDHHFLQGGFQDLARKYEQVPDNSDSAFRELVQHAYRVTETNYFRTIFCASLAKLAFTDSFPDADYAALVAGLPPLQHFEPSAALRALAKGELEFDAFLKRFRHHSRRELDIRAPRWDEDPDWVRTLAASTLPQATFDPAARYQDALRASLERVPIYRRRSFRRKLERLRHFLWLREEMRDLSSRMYYLLRRHVLAIAERRGLGDDIFFMTFREILEDDRSKVQGQRELYESYRNFKAPNEIGARFGLKQPEVPGSSLRGIVASRGSVRGIARVVRSIEEAATVERGQILVCPFTDPGWTPILSRVSGVITETGGLLSHAAIICREYGIPAVLGVPDATTRIPDRSEVNLCGFDGTVEVKPLATAQGDGAPGHDRRSLNPAWPTSRPPLSLRGRRKRRRVSS